MRSHPFASLLESFLFQAVLDVLAAESFFDVLAGALVVAAKLEPAGSVVVADHALKTLIPQKSFGHCLGRLFVPSVVTQFHASQGLPGWPRMFGLWYFEDARSPVLAVQSFAAVVVNPASLATSPASLLSSSLAVPVVAIAVALVTHVQ